jgi:hypothetical protein
LGSTVFWKKDKWPIWSEKFLSKAKRSRFEDVLLGKMNIPKSDEEIDENTEEGKVLIKNVVLNEMGYTDLILSIDARRINGKVVFSMIKGCKSRDYTDGNSALTWDENKKKFDPVSDASLVNTERGFRQSQLEKREDPEIWITNLEELHLKLEDMESYMTDSRFMRQVLNSRINEYELQMVMMEKRIMNKENTPSIDELREALSLSYERI